MATENTEPKRYLYAELASAIEARQNCARLTPDNAMHNPEWFEKWTERINDLVDLLPSGSGIDTGTEIDLDRSTGEKIVLYLSFHHMNDGFYSGWTDHTVIVRPSFRGINVRISGRDRNGIKEYLAETYDYALTQEVEQIKA